MKFIKNFFYDVKQGIWKNKFLFLCPAVISGLSFADFQIRNLLFSNECTFADIWIYLFGGMICPVEKNLLPINWVVVMAVLSFLLLHYPDRDIHGFGRLTLVNAGGRSLWWISKFLWNILSVIIYYAICAAVTLVCCLFCGIPLSNNINMELLSLLFGLEYIPGIQMSAEQIPVIVMFMPLIISAVFNLAEMTLTLFLKPIFGFFTVFVLMVSSIYILSPLSYGGYAMLLRYKWVYENGLSCRDAFIFSAAAAVFIFFAGFIKFRRYDILNQD